MNYKYKYIVIDHDKAAFENLKNVLKEYPELEKVGHAENAQQGIAMALRLAPHIIFLDIELGADNGFDVLKKIKHYRSDFPFFILTTDSNKYAKEAVNNDVLYFLEKPISPEELALSISKFEKHYFALQNFITIKNSEGHFFINLRTVKYISSSDNYCFIHREDAQPMMVSRTLKDLESILPPTFVRIHKCHIVNRNFILMMNTTTRIVRMNFINSNTSKNMELPIGNLYLEKAKRLLLCS